MLKKIFNRKDQMPARDDVPGKSKHDSSFEKVQKLMKRVSFFHRDDDLQLNNSVKQVVDDVAKISVEIQTSHLSNDVPLNNFFIEKEDIPREKILESFEDGTTCVKQDGVNIEDGINIEDEVNIEDGVNIENGVNIEDDVYTKNRVNIDDGINNECGDSVHRLENNDLRKSAEGIVNYSYSHRIQGINCATTHVDEFEDQGSKLKLYLVSDRCSSGCRCSCPAVGKLCTHSDNLCCREGDCTAVTEELVTPLDANITPFNICMSSNSGSLDASNSKRLEDGSRQIDGSIIDEQTKDVVIFRKKPALMNNSNCQVFPEKMQNSSRPGDKRMTVYTDSGDYLKGWTNDDDQLVTSQNGDCLNKAKDPLTKNKRGKRMSLNFFKRSTSFLHLFSSEKRTLENSDATEDAKVRNQTNMQLPTEQHTVDNKSLTSCQTDFVSTKSEINEECNNQRKPSRPKTLFEPVMMLPYESDSSRTLRRSWESKDLEGRDNHGEQYECPAVLTKKSGWKKHFTGLFWKKRATVDLSELMHNADDPTPDGAGGSRKRNTLKDYKAVSVYSNEDQVLTRSIPDRPILQTQVQQSRAEGDAELDQFGDSLPPPIPAKLYHKQNAQTPSGHNFVQSLMNIKECGWYWGPLSWDEAEIKLADLVDGSFLVRDSSDDRYILSLSFRSQGRTHHTRIEHYKGVFSFFSQPSSHGASTVVEFIEKAMEHSRNGNFHYYLRPRGPGQPPAQVLLLYPVSRFWHVRSLQHLCRFVILKHVRRDLISDLPLPRRINEYLQQRQYYIESEDGIDF